MKVFSCSEEFQSKKVSKQATKVSSVITRIECISSLEKKKRAKEELDREKARKRKKGEKESEKKKESEFGQKIRKKNKKKLKGLKLSKIIPKIVEKNF